MKNEGILELVRQHCEQILNREVIQSLAFHNIIHTKEVVDQVKIIGNALGISPPELEIVTIAAWFHDTGFCKTYYGHEEISIEIAKEFLQKENYPNDKIDKVVLCIKGTKIPQNPLNLLAEILSDADIFHISTDSFFYRKLLLRREWELVLSKYSTDLEWHKLNLGFLLNHKFFTAYGKDVLMKGQKVNEERVRNLIDLYE